MNAGPTSYDKVAYPTILFQKTRPDRLAVIARLHGLDATSPETARTLQVGGGDGLDSIALAAAFPRAEFINFDIAEQPILRGRRLSEAAVITNIRHRVLDLMEAADRLEGSFDYIIAHGVYAWVPPPVREAVMPLIARLLAPKGVAFVSYNTYPGGHSRAALREMLRHHISPLTDPAEQIAAARELLKNFVTPRPGDEPITAAMRREAEAALTYSDGLLFHDGLNECFFPQALTTVVKDARAHGLAYLGEASGGGLDKGFLDPDRAGINEEDLLRRLQAMDYAQGRYFRASLFVRDTAPFSRVVSTEAARSMWARSRAVERPDQGFVLGKKSMRIADERRASTLRRLVAASQRWVPVQEVADDDVMLAALCHQALEEFADLSTVAPPFAGRAPERPRANPLARVQIADGEARLASFDHQLVEVTDEALRRLICLLDGGRDRAALEMEWIPLSGTRDIPLQRALDWLTERALIAA